MKPTNQAAVSADLLLADLRSAKIRQTHAAD
jgi:hypothetical protein